MRRKLRHIYSWPSSSRPVAYIKWSHAVTSLSTRVRELLASNKCQEVCSDWDGFHPFSDSVFKWAIGVFFSIIYKSWPKTLSQPVRIWGKDHNFCPAGNRALIVQPTAQSIYWLLSPLPCVLYKSMCRSCRWKAANTSTESWTPAVQPMASHCTPLSRAKARTVQINRHKRST